MKSEKRKSGNKKHSRNKTKCEWYRRMGKRERSHIRRIERHMKRYKDSSPMAREALAKYRELAKV